MLIVPDALLIAGVAVALAVLLECGIKVASHYFGGFGLVTSRIGWILLMSIWWIVSIAISTRISSKLKLLIG
jgi:uncharacterized membrane protein